MKNWFKTFQTPEFDIIVRKGFDENTDKAEIHFIVHLTDHGLEANAKLGFQTEKERDKDFENVTEEMSVRIIQPIINFILNTIEQ